MNVKHQSRDERTYEVPQDISSASAMDDALRFLEEEVLSLGETVERLGRALEPVSKASLVEAKEAPAAPISSSRMRMQILQFASRVKDRRCELSRMMERIEL